MKAVIRIKAVIAFGVPFFTALGAALAPYAMEGSIVPDSKVKQFIICAIIASAAMVAGLSGIGSFLSTSFANSQASTAGAPGAIVAPTTN